MATLLKRDKSETDAPEQDSEALRAENEELRKQLDQREHQADFTTAGERDLRVEELEKQNKKLAAEREELQKEKRMREFVKEASEFEMVYEPTALGGALEEIERSCSEETGEIISKLLVACRAASEQENTSKLFAQLTKTEAEAVEDPKETLEKAAKARANEKSITKEQATVEILNEDSELRDALYKENE